MTSSRQPRCGHASVRARCDVCRAFYRRQPVPLVEEDDQTIDVLGTDFYALDAKVEEFVQAVRLDPGYLEDIALEFHAVQERKRS